MGKVLVLRTSNADGTSRNGFQWPAKGPVECPDWNPRAECGNGLHGLLWAEGNAGLLSEASDALWQVVEVEAESIVKIDNEKVKFPRGVVVYSGNRNDALQMVLQNRQRLDEIRAVAERGDGGSVATTNTYAHASTAGRSAHASTAGLSAHASTAGEYAHASTAGEYAHASTAGLSAHASTAGRSAHASTAGLSAHASTAGRSAHASTAGENSISAGLGLNSRVKAGKKGVIIASWWDEKAERIRVITGHIGEKGVKADTWYQVEVVAGKAKWKAVE